MCGNRWEWQRTAGAEEEIMRSARIKAEGAGYYHIISRVIERKRVLARSEKEKFRKLMRLVAEFSEVQILTWSCLSNHWHILAYVRERREISDEELVEKLKLLYDEDLVNDVAMRLKAYREEGRHAWAEELKAKYTYRMFDLSQFMKTFKQRYTQWYNRRMKRRGTLWEERFKSVMIQGSQHALSTIAAYIDLNAVRAGIVKDPKDYRYCGYAEAVAGVKEAREGVKAVMLSLGQWSRWARVSAGYRKYLYVHGEEKGLGEDGRAKKAGFSRRTVREVLAQGGRLKPAEVLRCRVRYFSDGVVLGSREFVNEVFDKHRDEFGVKRKTGARELKRGHWGGLCTMRDLRLEVVTVPQRV